MTAMTDCLSADIKLGAVRSGLGTISRSRRHIRSGRGRSHEPAICYWRAKTASGGSSWGRFRGRPLAESSSSRQNLAPSDLGRPFRQVSFWRWARQPTERMNSALPFCPSLTRPTEATSSARWHRRKYRRCPTARSVGRCLLLFAVVGAAQASSSTNQQGVR